MTWVIPGGHSSTYGRARCGFFHQNNCKISRFKANIIPLHWQCASWRCSKGSPRSSVILNPSSWSIGSFNYSFFIVILYVVLSECTQWVQRLCICLRWMWQTYTMEAKLFSNSCVGELDVISRNFSNTLDSENLTDEGSRLVVVFFIVCLWCYLKVLY